MKPLTTVERYDYLEKFKAAKAVVVHTGVFHADDVFTVAYLQLLRKHFNLEPLTVYRNSLVKPSHTLDRGFIVADIGDGEFDHHFKEEDKPRRENGVPYAAFGLVVRAFHQGFLTEVEYKRLDEKFIQAIDYHDNNGSGNHLSQTISCFNYNWDEHPDDKEHNNSMERFMVAVNLATTILEMQLSSTRSICKARDLASKQLLTGNTVFMDEYAPVAEFYQNNPDIKFVGSPSNRGGYQVIACKDALGNLKATFPGKFRGTTRTNDNPDQNGMVFCHPSGFMASFVDKDHAKRFMNIMYSNYMREHGANEQN